MRSGVRSVVFACVASLVAAAAAATTSAPARAAGPLEDQRALPDAPRPPTLPELTHPDGEATLELTSGTITPRGTSEVRGHVPVHVARVAAEQPIGGRH